MRRKTPSCSSRRTRTDSAAADAAGAAGAGGGANPPGGAVVQFFLKARPQGEVTLEFLDGSGKLVNKFSTREAPRTQAGPADEEENPFRGAPPARLTAQAGMNTFVWNLRYPDATTFPGLIMWAGSTTGPRVSPGQYSVRLTVDGKIADAELRSEERPTAGDDARGVCATAFAIAADCATS